MESAQNQGSTWEDFRLDLLPSTFGITWRALKPTDADALASLIAQVEAADNPPYRTSSAEVSEMLVPDGRWQGVAVFATHGLIAGQMVGFALVSWRNGVTAQCWCQGGIHPRFRTLGIGRALLEWEVQASEELLGSGGGQVAMNVDSGREDLEDHLLRLGFHWERSYFELRAELPPTPTAPALGPWIELKPWDDALDEDVRRASNRLKEQQGSRATLTQEQWQLGRTNFVPSWSFVALDKHGDRPQVAGFVMASRYEQDWAVLGWREGYIDRMGVLEPWRLTHVADGLIQASMHAQLLDGMDRCGTGISASQHSGALSVYEHLGFRTVAQSRVYVLNL